ncbi:hypothetical protein ACO03V_06105 [Microbacterium sp. HMH0099]|uniref:hypothetical protein n=1 Tax=Microbacterium sp. HMH0099 TaxID=3414026 RepID=UPI003BF63E06
MNETPDAAHPGAPSTAEPSASPSDAATSDPVPGVPAAPDDASTTPQGPRQRVVKVGGARRARLLPAPGTSAEPAPADDRTRGRPVTPVASGPNDDRLRQDVPPHY